MRLHQLIALCAIVGAIGCAPQPDVRVRVDPRLDAQIASGWRHRLAAEDGQELKAAQAEEARAADQLASARSDLASARAERANAADSEVASVLDAKLSRMQANTHWCEAFYDMARWRTAAASARLELTKAEVLSRRGAVLDMQAFRDQYATLHEQFSLSAERVAAARAELDHKEGALVDAKSRYAEARLSR